MNISEFASKWRRVELTERSASQQHFLDLCEVFEHERLTWLDLAHKRLDEAVFSAYEWDVSIKDEEILARLLALNHERSSRQ